MHSNTFFLVASFVGLAVARPNHSLLHKHKHKRALEPMRILTPDNTCGNIEAGNNNGYMCDPGNWWGGACCSQYGYCGNSWAYCGDGCQGVFGECAREMTFSSTATPHLTAAASSSAPSYSTSTATPTLQHSHATTIATAPTAPTQASILSYPTTTSSTSALAPEFTVSSPTGFVNISPPATQSGCLWVVPGSGSFTHTQTFDFTQLSEFPSTDLVISNYDIAAGSAPFSQKYSKEQVSLGDGTLQLLVPGSQSASPILGAEVQTTIQDILYGSVRTTVQVSEVPGTCHGLFYYKSDTQESDIEILTADLASGVHYTNQPNVRGQISTTATHALPSNVTVVMHEYRLDWVEGRTVYYLDGVEQQVLTSNVPSVPGTWLWNNWSNGDSGWSAGPPEKDSVLKIEKIVMYFNRTSSVGSC